MDQRRIRGLGKSRKPLLVPGIEPVLSVMRREEHVKIRVVGGSLRQLHDQQRSVDGGCDHYDDAQRNRSPKEAGVRVQQLILAFVSDGLDSARADKVYSVSLRLS